MNLSNHFRSPNPKLPADNHQGSLRLKWQGPIHPQSCRASPGSATATHGQSLPCAAVYWLIELVVTRHCFKSIMVWKYLGWKVFFHNFCVSNQCVPKACKQTLLNILVSSIHLCLYVVIYVNTFDFVIRHIIPTIILCRTVCYPSHWPGNIVWSHPDTCIAYLTSKVPRVGNHKGSQFTYDMNWVRWPHFLTKISMRSSFFWNLKMK